jgi:hypothetical protein
MMSGVLETVSPLMYSFMFANPQEVGDGVRELQAATKAALEHWLNVGLWLVWDTPDYEARLKTP